MTDANFWNKIARGYAKRPIANMPAYEQTLDHVRRHLNTEQDVLEVGCGTGSTALLLAPNVAHYTGTDVASEMIAIANEKLATTPVPGLEFAVSDAALNDVGTESQDVVLAFNLYHLVPDLDASLRAARRVLKPGGLLITKTPCVASKWYLRPIIKVMQLVGKAPYLNYLSIKGYDMALQSAGFENLETARYAANSTNRFVVAKKQ